MKKVGSVIFVAIAIVASVWNFNQSRNEAKLSDLVLANIKALANSEGTGQSNRIITDEITSMEVLSNGIRTTYYRRCSLGGSQYCVSGTWTDFVPR